MNLTSGQPIEPVYGEYFAKLKDLPLFELRLDYLRYDVVRLILTGLGGGYFCVPLTEYFPTKEEAVDSFNKSIHLRFVLYSNTDLKNKSFFLKDGDSDELAALNKIISEDDLLLVNVTKLEILP